MRGDPKVIVDYDAWKRGYTPPCEHVLIDALAYRGAKVVVAMADLGKDAGQWWLVRLGDLSDDQLESIHECALMLIKRRKWMRASEADLPKPDPET